MALGSTLCSALNGKLARVEKDDIMCLLAKPQDLPLDLLERSKHELQLQLMGDAVIMCLPQQDYICILNSRDLIATAPVFGRMERKDAL